MILNPINPIAQSFLHLPPIIQEQALKFIQKVNEVHLHCEDQVLWARVHHIITGLFAEYIIDKAKKKLKNSNNTSQIDSIESHKSVSKIVKKPNKTSNPNEISKLSHKGYDILLKEVKDELRNVFFDPFFEKQIIDALQTHILTPLRADSNLVSLLCDWIKMNAMYLPLGLHLLNAYKEDMAGNSPFAKYVMKYYDVKILPQALIERTLLQMKKFLTEAEQANSQNYGQLGPRNEQPTAVILSVRDGHGGHTSPHQAMEARLKERGWKVETIHYDTDLSPESDFFQLAGVTFEDGTPMTDCLFATRWKMQKQNKDVARIVQYYILALQMLHPDLSKKTEGGDLLRKKILPLNPQLIVTTLAYHWTWKSLAYRVPTAKTLLVASDVFFHQRALFAWYRQQSIDPKLRQIHFAAMTDDLEILKSEGIVTDEYYAQKHPEKPQRSLANCFAGLYLDSQISVIGIPVQNAYKAIIDEEEIKILRNKWGIPNGFFSICISRGKLGNNNDLTEALESYRTNEALPYPIILHVICGENKEFYKKLVEGGFKDLGPNITVIPHPLLNPKDMAELRAISTIDDIKAGGGSTFEAWHLISQGTKSMLFLTPGKKLYWEKCNCIAMQKWNVGLTVTEGLNKISKIKEVMQNGLPPISNPCPDWKPLFDKTINFIHPKN